MREVDAIISLTSAAIHVVTICQSLGIPALLNLEKNGVSLQPGGGLVNSSGREIKEGDWITISSRRRTIYEGKAKFKPARLLRYMKGEPVELDEEEKKAFAFDRLRLPLLPAVDQRPHRSSRSPRSTKSFGW